MPSRSFIGCSTVFLFCYYRKSPGGVFFAMLKKSTPKKELREIFRMESQARKNVLKTSGGQSMKRTNVFSRLGPSPLWPKQDSSARDNMLVEEGGGATSSIRGNDVASTEGLEVLTSVMEGEMVERGAGDGESVEEGEVGGAEDEEEGEILMEVDGVDMDMTAIELTLAKSIPTFVQLDHNNMAGAEMEEERARIQEFESSNISFPTFVKLD